MNKPVNITVDTLGGIAKKYGISTRTLRDLININPDLKELVDKYRNVVNKEKGINKSVYILPISVVKEIYKVLGEIE